MDGRTPDRCTDPAQTSAVTNARLPDRHDAPPDYDWERRRRSDNNSEPEAASPLARSDYG